MLRVFSFFSTNLKTEKDITRIGFLVVGNELRIPIVIFVNNIFYLKKN